MLVRGSKAIKKRGQPELRDFLICCTIAGYAATGTMLIAGSAVSGAG